MFANYSEDLKYFLIFRAPEERKIVELVSFVGRGILHFNSYRGRVALGFLFALFCFVEDPIYVAITVIKDTGNVLYRRVKFITLLAFVFITGNYLAIVIEKYYCRVFL